MDPGDAEPKVARDVVQRQSLLLARPARMQRPFEGQGQPEALVAAAVAG